MAISLTDLPLPWQVTLRYVDFGGVMEPPLGGVSQRFGRLGSRYEAVFSSLPSLDGNCANALVAARILARKSGSTVKCPWPGVPFASAIGTPLVNGASQAGTSLIVDGLTASTTLLKAGSAFSFVAPSGRNYVYVVDTDATVNGSGQATLSIGPMLRESPADNAPLNFISPTIEGFIQGQVEEWQVTMRAWTTFPSFTIREVQ